MSACSARSNDATLKRKRGRQPGSKNKPKIPVANCMPHVATLHPHVLQIHAGGDVAETIAAFARGCRNFGVCVLSASGPIGAAVLWEASPYPSALTFQGSFNLLSFTATFLPGSSEGSLAVTLAGPHGQVVGGVVAGPVVAAGTVIVLAATFASSAFDRFGAVNNASASTLPVIGGEEVCGKSSATDSMLPVVGGEEGCGKISATDSMLPVVGGEEGCGKSSATDSMLPVVGGEEGCGKISATDSMLPVVGSEEGCGKSSATDSMLPVVGGEEGCGKSSATECEAEKSERDILRKRLEEMDQFLDLPPAAVEGVFIGDGASEEKTGQHGGGEEVDGNMLENYLKELEHCIEVPADVGGAFKCVGGGVEEKTAGLHGDSGGEGEGNPCFHHDLQMVVDDEFGGSRDGCGEHFITFDEFWLSDACLPLY
ncbi:hypothetical protein M5K25_012855 [Dendrobium thyrsiflorum]|uniref:PPC domain-containing protein n=1 Tax=Dendrobium thyrsiflorum TaxID=117978 RepID=A0ABD0UYZ7_DENTH